MKKTRGLPSLISVQNEQIPLQRIILGAGTFSEDWLQALIHERPDVLPISQIEPGFGVPVAIAREVPCGHGYIDNLLLTPNGEIILVETKLWANPQARREVVAQALDYVSALTLLGYEAFQSIIAKAPDGPKALYSRITGQGDALTEAEFVDAVSRNLARGRMLVLVVGDGIRREAESLGALLQSHAGAHFTFALVELATWRNTATGDVLVIPDVLAQTVMIERGVVRLVDGVMQVQPTLTNVTSKPSTLSEEMFFEEMAKHDSNMPGLVRDFLSLVEPLGIYPDFKASLNLKLDVPDSAKPLNFGYITKSGKLWTDPLAAVVQQGCAIRYSEALAHLIGGKLGDAKGIYVTTNGKSAPVVTALLPTHAEAWAAAIRQVTDEIHAASRDAA